MSDTTTSATLHDGEGTDAAQHLTVAVTGMTCDMCAHTVAKALIGIEGVSGVKVWKDEGKAMLNAEPSVTLEVIKEAVAQTKDYAVTGLL